MSMVDNSSKDGDEVGSSHGSLDDPVKQLGRQHSKTQTYLALICLYCNFFKPEVVVQTHQGWPCHFFTCAARRCKTTVGVRRFQDSKEKASTANLKHHAIKCFGAEVVDNAAKGSNVPGQSSSIFSVFARPGQQPVQYSHRSHTNLEVQYEGS
jgi:hypothetical protein